MFLILFVLAIIIFMVVDECFLRRCDRPQYTQKNIKLERKLEMKETKLSECNKIITQQKELIETLKIEEQKAKGNYESLRKGFVNQFRCLERKNKILEEQEVRLKQIKQLEEQNQYYSELINQLKKQQQEFLNRFSNINNLTTL